MERSSLEGMRRGAIKTSSEEALLPAAPKPPATGARKTGGTDRTPLDQLGTGGFTSGAIEGPLGLERLGKTDGTLEGGWLRKCFRCMVEFQWFLMALSVRPGRYFAISAHLFPNFLCSSMIF